MDRRSYLKASLAFGTSLLMPAGVVALAGCSGTVTTPELTGFNGHIMGTGYSVRLGADIDLSDAELAQLANEVKVALLDVDTHMSTWRTDSELSVISDTVHTDWQPLTAGTTQVIAEALSTSELSGGAFDVTIGPLVDLWGFGASSDANTGGVPAQQAIARHLRHVGHDTIEIDATGNRLRKHDGNARLDLSGIAKGHAVDQIASLLGRKGYNSYLVEVGGELRARGNKQGDRSWRVAIERPVAGRREAFRAVSLQDSAIATSGDYRNFFADGGQRYSHSIDPRTGQPVNHELASVSVVADSTMVADALSTAMMVMGPDDAMVFAEQNNVATHLILKSGSALEEVYSPAFEPLMS